MRKNRLRLNLKKCAFEVGSRNFLRFLVSQIGIEMALELVKAITQLQPPVTRKKIQALMGKLAMLNRFISRYLDCLRPFLTALKGAPSNGWGPECAKAFQSIKKYVASPLALFEPVDGEELYLYLATSTKTVNAALVRLDKHGK